MPYLDGPLVSYRIFMESQVKKKAKIKFIMPLIKDGQC